MSVLDRFQTLADDIRYICFWPIADLEEPPSDCGRWGSASDPELTLVLRTVATALQQKADYMHIVAFVTEAAPVQRIFIHID